MPTATAPNVYDLILLAVVAEIQGLDLQGDGLTGNIGSNVYAQMLPVSDNVKLPAAYCTLDTEAEELEASTFEDVDLRYSVSVLIAARDSVRHQKPRPVYLTWRQTVLRHFSDMASLSDFGALGDIPQLYDVEAVPRVAIKDDEPAYQKVVTGLTVRVYTRQDRLRLPS